MPKLEETRLPLDLAVRWSDEVFHHCLHAAPHPAWEDFPSLVLFRHLIKMADGIQLLLSAGTSEPTIPLLRSMLEALFSLKYIHLDNYRPRSLCWLYAYIDQEMAFKEKINIGSESGEELRAVLATEHAMVSVNQTSSSSRIRDDVAELRDHLKHPDFKQMENEYAAFQQQGRSRKPPRWYKLFGGPINIYKLAEAVGMLSEYKVYYEWWSATVHGTDATRLLFQQEDGSAEFQQLRSLEYPELEAQAAELFLQLACQLMVRKFLRKGDLEVLLSRFDLIAGKER
jgi:Family of unknown function (DUF5677)